MRYRLQLTLLFIALCLVGAGTYLSLTYHSSRLSSLEVQYADLENQFSDLLQEYRLVYLEQWILNELGTSPRNISAQDLTDQPSIYVFYNQTPRQSYASKFDPIAHDHNVTINYLSLDNLTNLELLTTIWTKIGLSQPDSAQEYLLFLSPVKIVILHPDRVNEEVFGKCLEYLNLSLVQI